MNVTRQILGWKLADGNLTTLYLMPFLRMFASLAKSSSLARDLALPPPPCCAPQLRSRYASTLTRVLAQRPPARRVIHTNAKSVMHLGMARIPALRANRD